MPYKTNRDLPEAVREHLPEHAQDIFRAAYNSASEEYKKDETAFRVAWAAVKHEYHKDERSGEWVSGPSHDEPGPHREEP
jgi:cation transport regulator